MARLPLPSACPERSEEARRRNEDAMARGLAELPPAELERLQRASGATPELLTPKEVLRGTPRAAGAIGRPPEAIPDRPEEAVACEGAGRSGGEGTYREAL
jgi:hypothetical protein